ncbi:MAG: hypothetical protein DMG60_09330 [Acidobacteria bacterium]|nr:MAG: hypothetical protein DMG60_09330 [Acidobacteriota bacterium]
MNCRVFCAAVLALLTAPIAGHAQSLGEIARQQKDSKSQKSNTQPASPPKKVYTDENIGKSESTDAGKAPAAGKPATNSATEKEKNQPAASADQLRANIQKKKDLIVALQQRIDKLQASVNFVQNNRNIYTNAPEYNEHQHQKELAVERLKAELEQQKAELSDLQDQARDQGFGNSVYQ